MNEFEVQRENNKDFLSNTKKSTLNTESYLQISLIEDAIAREAKPVTHLGVPDMNTYIEEQEKRTAELLEEDNREKMNDYIEECVSRPEFHEALRLYQENQSILETANDDRKALKEFWKEHPDFYYEDVRQKELQILDLNQEQAILWHQIGEYKDSYSQVVAREAELEEEELKAQGLWREYDKDTLGNLQETSEYPSGSREWLEQRQKGLGGSDIGPIVGAPGAYNSRKDILKSKVLPISEEQVREQANNNETYAGALGRGNAWEKRIYNRMLKEHPEFNLTFSKKSWADKDHPYRTANFDGLLADENGNPDGVLEIKTASDPRKWGPVEGGINSIPPTYRSQVLWYTHLAGLKRAAVAVAINDHELRVYKFDITPSLEAESRSNVEKAEEFMDEVREMRKHPEKLLSTASKKGFSRTALSSRAVSSKENIFREVAVMRGTKPEQVKREFVRSFKKGEPDTPDNTAKHLKQLYIKTAQRKHLPSYLAVDIETTNTHQLRGSIIEVGASVRLGTEQSHDETEKFSKLYGVSKKSELANGMGAVDVHGITSTQVAKKRQFLNPEEGAKFLQLAKKCKVLMAHNATFENKWFTTHVPGYADAVRHGEISILDTMTVTQHVVDSDHNKLESLVEHYGIPYANAHRAYNDAEMMAQGYEAVLKDLREQ